MKLILLNLKLSAIVLCLTVLATTPTQAQSTAKASVAVNKDKAPTIREARVLFDNGDFAAAYKPLKRLARNGSVEADYLLYVMYVEGKGVTADIPTAMKYLRVAATQNYRRTPGKFGYADAQYALGKRYAAGDGVKKNAKNALNNFIRAARQGHTNALIEIPAYYAGEKGLAADAERGYEWALISVKQLSGEQQQAATQYASQFKAKLNQRKQRQIEVKVANWQVRRD
jgi:TPR repeat protein